MNKKMRRLAIRSVLSVKVRDDEVVVIDGLREIEPRTKAMLALLAQLPASQRSTLIVVGPGEEWESVYRAGSNLPGVKIIRAGYVNIHDVLGHERLVLTVEAVQTIHDLWAVR